MTSFSLGGPGPGCSAARVRRLAAKEGVPFFAVSALTGKGLKELAAGMARALEPVERGQGKAPE